MTELLKKKKGFFCFISVSRPIFLMQAACIQISGLSYYSMMPQKHSIDFGSAPHQRLCVCMCVYTHPQPLFQSLSFKHTRMQAITYWNTQIRQNVHKYAFTWMNIHDEIFAGDCCNAHCGRHTEKNHGYVQNAVLEK